MAVQGANEVGADQWFCFAFWKQWRDDWNGGCCGRSKGGGIRRASQEGGVGPLRASDRGWRLGSVGGERLGRASRWVGGSGHRAGDR